MKKHAFAIIVLIMLISGILQACTMNRINRQISKQDNADQRQQIYNKNLTGISYVNTYRNKQTNTLKDTHDSGLQNDENKRKNRAADIKANESGKIMVVMFHNFVEKFSSKGSDDGQYTITFDRFRELLQTLYDRKYRLISMRDYLNNNITVPEGCKPIIFTFDDASPGQFSLVEQNGNLMINPKSAGGIMDECHSIHPDFGIKGTFYVSLGKSTFEGRGTLEERLKYLINKGFEIGNHTLNHIDISRAGSGYELQKEIGGNQKMISELVPGYIMDTLALPFGASSDVNKDYIISGNYEGVEYQNRAILLVGSEPTLSPVNKYSTPLSMSRVRAPGINPVQYDLDWWLKNINPDEEYISDGDPDTVAVPKAKEELIDKNKLQGKTLILW
mgnify:FL=1